MRRFIGVAAAMPAIYGAALAAQAASIDVGQAVTGGVVELINGAIAAGITALVGWVLMTVKNKFHVEIEAKHREALTQFLQRQA